MSRAALPRDIREAGRHAFSPFVGAVNFAGVIADELMKRCGVQRIRD